MTHALIPEFLSITDAAEYVEREHGRLRKPGWFLELAASGNLPVFAFVRKDICVLDRPVPIGDGPVMKDIQLAFDMGKRIIHEAGSYARIDRHDKLAALRTEGTASIDSVFLDGMRHDIAGEPVLTGHGVFAPPARWNISMDDLRVRTEDIDRLIKVSPGETAKVDDGVTAKSKAGRKPGKQADRMRQILDELEKWALNECIPFDRQAMPGQVGKGPADDGSFHWFCASLPKPFKTDFQKGTRAFENYRAGLCVFPPWPKPNNFYRDALPHIAQSLQSVVSNSVSPTKARKSR